VNLFYGKVLFTSDISANKYKIATSVKIIATTAASSRQFFKGIPNLLSDWL